MYKFAVILYLSCFGLYILFTRQPDFFDGEITKGTIHFMMDSTGKPQPYAFYSAGLQNHSFNADYLFRKLEEGERVNIIFETSNPEKAEIYSLWGYWLRWGELIFSIILLVVSVQIALAINKNPTPESLIEQLEDKPVRKRKYRL